MPPKVDIAGQRFGRTMIATDWANELGMDVRVLCGRLKKGWPVERALTEPVRATPPRGLPKPPKLCELTAEYRELTRDTANENSERVLHLAKAIADRVSRAKPKTSRRSP